MSTPDDGSMTARCFYAPAAGGQSLAAEAERLARELANDRKARFTVLASQRQDLPDRLRKAGQVVVTEKVVLAWQPSPKAMLKTQRSRESALILVEQLRDEHLGWAKLRGAHNLATGQPLKPGLSERGRRLLGEVISAGNHGWTDSTHLAIAIGYLNDLREHDEYDRAVVEAFILDGIGLHNAIDHVRKLLDAFDKQ